MWGLRGRAESRATRCSCVGLRCDLEDGSLTHRPGSRAGSRPSGRSQLGMLSRRW
ncbi:hypothetical protein HMPREF9057_00409 [Actinomyces sp. oral taxon 171 str. F0337]|nr:hypothetical protein HMPREF9057_00409 [Actinomyces sp. oral taxon 171 str. F0337]